MSEEEYMECSVVAYPRQIKFLHINGGAINYYVDRHISDYVNRLQKENEKNKHYKTLYQILKRQKEELRDWLKEDNDKIKVYDTKNNKAVELGIVLGLGMCVDKMEELEGVSNE